MSVRYSTGAKNARAGKRASIHAIMRATTIAFVDSGTSAVDSMTDSGNGFVTAGFRPGDKITIKTASGTNDKEVIAITVVAGTITVATGSFTNESASQQVALAAALGGSVKDLFDYGVVHIYSSPQPASADDAETGTLLAVITDSGATFTPGAIANGLRFEADPVNGKISKLATQTWSTLACLASGTAAWGRIHDNARTMGASSTAVRADFTVGVSGADMNGGTTSLQAGAPTGVNNFGVTTL